MELIENWCCAIARTGSKNSGSLFHTACSPSCCVVEHGLCCNTAAACWIRTLLGAQTFFSPFTKLGKEGTKGFSVHQDL